MQLTVIDNNEEYKITYSRYEYASLMELITNTYFSEIGSCRGKAICGTCIIKIVDGKNIDHTRTKQEKYTLLVNDSKEKEYRLSCQILLDENIDQAVFEVMNLI